MESADNDDRGAIRSAIDSATESASTYAAEAAESLTQNAERAKDAVADGAAATAAGFGFSQRSDRRDSRPSYGDRSRGYGGRDDRSFDGSAPRNSFREPAQLTPSPNIYIGNLLFDITAADLEREFAEHGVVKKAFIAADARGLSKG